MAEKHTKITPNIHQVQHCVSVYRLMDLLRPVVFVTSFLNWFSSFHAGFLFM